VNARPAQVHTPTDGGQPTVKSHSAHELSDDALAEEIRLLGELVLAASSMRRHLTPDEVDRALQLGRSDWGTGDPPQSPGCAAN